MKFIKLTERDQQTSNPPQTIWVNPMHLITFEVWNRSLPENGARLFIGGQEGASIWVTETADEVARLLDEAA